MQAPDGCELMAYMWHVVIQGVKWKFAWTPNDSRMFMSFQISDDRWSRFVTTDRTIRDMEEAVSYVSNWVYWRAHRSLQESE